MEYVQPFLLGWPGPWVEIHDGDSSARALFHRHYSRYIYKDGRQPKLFVGPGFKTVLLSPNADALFVWRKFKDASGQKGVNCAVFRNESDTVASELIRAADEIAFKKWPGLRHYTFVNPAKVKRGRQPGRCFLKAGWVYVKDEKGQRVRTKARKLYILERLPDAN